VVCTASPDCVVSVWWVLGQPLTLNWYSSPARPFAAPEGPRLVTGQQGSPALACQQIFRAQTVCAGGSSEGSTELKHGTELG